jgi:arsenate reductase (thioredoxin)
MKKTILFICTHNSCRSQMAEGWVKKLKGDTFEPYSAGIEKRKLDPLAVKVMAEAGVDISKQSSKTISELDINNFDVVVTICDDANKKCPLFPGVAKRIHNPFDNPSKIAKTLKSEEEVIQLYRRVRDEILEFVKQMPSNL